MVDPVYLHSLPSLISLHIVLHGPPSEAALNQLPSSVGDISDTSVDGITGSIQTYSKHMPF